MKHIICTSLIAISLFSCNGNSDVAETNSDSIKVDTAAVSLANIEIDMNSLMSKYSHTSALPFKLDSAELASYPANDSFLLSTDEVKYLSFGFVENDLSYGGQNTIADVLFFDSLKLNDGYDGYVEVLDIGMMKDAVAYTSQKITIDDSTSLLLWYISFGTYEACPYFSGRLLYASVLRNNQVTSCTVVGEDSGGGDAPYWSETVSLCSFTTGNFTAIKYDRNGGDEDEEGNEIVDESSTEFILQLTPAGTWEVKAVEPV